MELIELARGLMASWQIRLLIGFAAAVYLYGLRPMQRWKLRHFPGPAAAWLLGSGPLVKKHGGIALAHQAMCRVYGPVWASIGSPEPMIVTDHPELARKMMLLSSMRPAFPSLFFGREREFEAGNIVAARGEKHKSLRAAWQPMFFSGSLEAFSVLMNEAAELLIDTLSAAAKAGRSVDIHRLLGDMTMAVVGTTAFGVDFHTQAGDDTASAGPDADAERLRDAANTLFRVNPMTFSVWTALLFLFPIAAPLVRLLAAALPDKGVRRMLGARQAVQDVALRLVADHRRFLAQDSAAAPKEPPNATPGAPPLPPGDAHALPANNGRARGGPVRRGVAPGSFLDLLMRAADRTTGRGFTDLEVANQVNVMILAGFETTANALAFATYLLSTNPTKRERLLAEVDAFGRKRVPTLHDLDKLPYLEACLKESLRLFPPATTIIRMATRHMELGGFRVEPGQWLAVAAYSMHRNPAYWQDPEAYLPERYMPGTPEAAAVPEHGWVPFGEGTRACIGLRFALEEAKIALLRLCQRFTFELEPGQEPLQVRQSNILAPEGGLCVRVVPRGLQPEA
ncbi:hypothetical protein WJX81_005128 [Elliptochloris bilobata]|uniref:Cytochrome P450 n=1 Tax=Elliptochloris bilobata TaxID=381761 RepID=A0AAW1R2P0_9CHLO